MKRDLNILVSCAYLAVSLLILLTTKELHEPRSTERLVSTGISSVFFAAFIMRRLRD